MCCGGFHGQIRRGLVTFVCFLVCFIDLHVSLFKYRVKLMGALPTRFYHIFNHAFGSPSDVTDLPHGVGYGDDGRTAGQGHISWDIL